MKTILKTIIVLSVVSPALASASFAEEKAQSTSDLSQKQQFQLTEANNVYNRTTKLQASLLKANNDTKNQIIQKMN